MDALDLSALIALGFVAGVAGGLLGVGGGVVFVPALVVFGHLTQLHAVATSWRSCWSPSSAPRGSAGTATCGSRTAS
jgi:hypothetical protein